MKRLILSITVLAYSTFCAAYYDYDVAEDAGESGGLFYLIDLFAQYILLPVFWLLIIFFGLGFAIIWIKENIKKIIEIPAQLQLPMDSFNVIIRRLLKSSRFLTKYLIQY
ncbi:hypothetical protein [Prevotella disiens]|uniref:Uncharacterized protein n=1 Tax=Prevotella disiens DNF00882 TaxID=1401075 RepID=A0A096CF62_9BACT|nr:hypothetical protein [Prevotella disiens]KGF43869.1 hypothetical protein HMPREF0654_13060 [Prevotella disiens DNF00882]